MIAFSNYSGYGKAKSEMQGSTFYPPSQKTMGVSPWMNATVGPAVALAEVGASADSAEEKEGYHGCKLVVAS